MKISADAISRAQAGDKVAREELIVALIPLVRHIAKEYAHGGVAADDLQSEGVAELLERLPNYDPERGSFEKWALGVVRRRCCQVLASERRLAASNCDLTCLPRPSHDAGGEIALSLLSLLPAGHRVLFQRYYGIDREAEDRADIAASLGITRDMLRKRMERIKSNLRRRALSRKADTVCHEFESKL